MSLFKARDWWSTIVGDDEEFDQGCMCVGNLDNSSSGADKIIVGSYHGFLRIYNPRPVKTEQGWGGFRPEDVMCETSLNQPILQVECGRFVSGADGIYLAVLHPRKLSVYSLVGTSGAVEHGTHYQLKLAYEHNLQRTAFNFCSGPFGGVKGRDFLCVQSMDGTVSVFEQESFAFSRFLPSALLPGPIQYVPRTDSFVTVSSSRQLESYKYQVLAVATDARTKEESQTLKSGKRVAVDWVLGLCDQALDMFVASFNNSQQAIYVLGERNLYMVSEAGKLLMMKKLDYNPSCFHPYASLKEGEISCLVGTHTKTVLIYQNITLKWAAQLNSVPVALRIANFHDLKGIIVSLDEVGHLQCSYLGTDPAMYTTTSAEVRELDYAELDAEMKQLQKVIKEQQNKSAPLLPNQPSDDEVQILVSVPPNLDEISVADDVEIKDEEKIPSMTVKISIKAKSHLTDVKVHIHTPLPLTTNENLITFASLEPNHPGETQVSFFMKTDILPADLKADITTTYQSTSGAPRVVTSSVRLPLKLVVKPVLPVKMATYKITVDTNKPPVNLNDIFPELLGESAGGPGNALGFGFYGMEPVITMLASKTSQRYRLQCDDFASMWPLLSELLQRLNSYFKAGRTSSDFKVTYEGPLPLQEYFDVLDAHFECRVNADKFSQLLEERAAQFRAIQRRLLTRFKDKTPAPLANLDTLLDGTYRQILALAEASEENTRAQERASAALSCATRIINQLIRLWQDLSNEEFAILEASLLPTVMDNGTQGWEETVDAAITHLLRTCMAKSAKDQTVNPSPLGLLKDTTKLKKHIALLCDRLGKGAKLIIEGVKPVTASPGNEVSKPHKAPTSIPTGSMESQRRKTKRIPTTLDTVSESSSRRSTMEEPSVPVGSKFGEKKAPERKEIPPLNGASDEGSRLPSLGQGPIGDGRSGMDFLKKKQTSAEELEEEGEKSRAMRDIPDLDELGMPESSEDQPYLNGGEEVYWSDLCFIRPSQSQHLIFENHPQRSHV